jgi:oleate hydratase
MVGEGSAQPRGDPDLLGPDTRPLCARPFPVIVSATTSGAGMADQSKDSQVYLVGGGIASLSAAAFLIRDTGRSGETIHILEQLTLAGGSMDGGPAAGGGFVTRGGRMFEEEHYVCLWDLLADIPSLEDPDVSVRAEFLSFNQDHPTLARARILLADGSTADASDLGLDTHARVAMAHLLSSPEYLIGTRRIDDYFNDAFFASNFWCLWRTTFAFQTWHSAIELKRYFLCFIQEFDRIHTLAGVRRSKYNQYDSVIRPIQRWLQNQGVQTHYGVTVTDIDFDEAGARRASRLQLVNDNGNPQTIGLAEDDYVFVTLGSMTSDTSYGDDTTAPELIRDKRDGAWRLWDTIAPKAGDFGRPNTFTGNIEQTKWESFTLTMTGRMLLDRIEQRTGNVAGEGALMTWKDSGWLLSIVIPAQPHFAEQPLDSYTLWGYGLFGDRPGDYVATTLDDAAGTEILDELLGHLGVDDIADEVRATTQVTTVQMPYIDSQFQPRVVEDRPLVVPDGAENYAFLGQFVEIPEGVVFTVEYSVRGAMMAVHHHFEVDRPIPAMYRGLADVKVARSALRTAFA